MCRGKALTKASLKLELPGPAMHLDNEGQGWKAAWTTRVLGALCYHRNLRIQERREEKTGGGRERAELQ